MKNIPVLILCFSLFLLLNSCNNNKAGSSEPTAKEVMPFNEDKDLTGTFTADGKALNGKVSTQVFPSTKEFSVLCQDDTDPNNSRLIQFVFKDEASARAGGDFKIVYDDIMSAEGSNEISFALDNTYHTREDTKGMVTISKEGSGNVINFDDVALTDSEKKDVIVKGKIPF